MLGLQQVFPLVFVGGVQQELGMNYLEVLPFLMDASLAQQEDLLALSQGLNRYGPFLERNLALVWQHLNSPQHLNFLEYQYNLKIVNASYGSIWRTGSQSPFQRLGKN